MASTALRRMIVTRPLLAAVANAIPRLSPTESEAIDAGDRWWDAELFTGNPDWDQMLSMPEAELSDEEKAFLDGPVEELCAMLDDWKMTWETRDLSPEAWEFLKRHKFFGMIVPMAYGGLGFSAFAHSEVVRKIATRSISGAVTAMVPNSLGPGELLLQFGTDAQRRYWLPRLADGREIPCFGLTSPEGGSDAAAMIDEGVICHGEWDGERVLGMRLNWNKRYITLAPVATLLGLAFKLRDPDHLLGEREELGITVALVPTGLPGIEIGERHIPAMQAFQNGPTRGRDVFLPLDHIIGGPDRIGQGWRMLMSALAAGRGISLPSMAAAAAGFAALTTGAYARIREQFNLPIGKFEGVQEKLARIAANAYVLDAARRMTCAALDAGHHPAVISSIMKLHATERMRVVVNDAMDVHGGKTIIEGPRNYLSDKYRALPVAITVEGANILTRGLMVFGQGAIRSHPFLLDEIRALGDARHERALVRFDDLLWDHVGHLFTTTGRATWRAWTGGAFAPAPRSAGRARRYYRRLGRYSAAFALLSDVALLTLGGGIKRRELLSARLGDILSEMYLLSAVLKRWEDEGRQDADWPVLQYVMADGSARIERRFDAILANLPLPPVAAMLRVMILPFGVRHRGPSDRLVRKCARCITEPGATRDRLVGDVYVGSENEAVGQLMAAFDKVVETGPLRDRLRRARVADWRRAGPRQLSDAERRALAEVDRLVGQAIAVDSFAAGELEGKTQRSAPALEPAE